MTTSKHKQSHHDSEYDLQADVEKIKAALLEASHDVKGRAAEILADSIGDVNEKSMAVKQNIESYTAEQPLKSLGIALLTGIAIGYLLRK